LKHANRRNPTSPEFGGDTVSFPRVERGLEFANPASLRIIYALGLILKNDMRGKRQCRPLLRTNVLSATLVAIPAITLSIPDVLGGFVVVGEPQKH
jgi:hypothetical protein